MGRGGEEEERGRERKRGEGERGHRRGDERSGCMGA